MDLIKIQNLLSKLYTNKKFRDNFFSNYESFLEDYSLNKEDAKEIILKKEEIIFFAKSLIIKRREEVRKIIPLTSIYIKNTFNELFSSFSEIFTPNGIKKHLEDSYNFLIFLEKNLNNDLLLKNIIKYEKNFLINILSPKNNIIYFHYCITDIKKILSLDNLEEKNKFIKRLKYKPAIFINLKYKNSWFGIYINIFNRIFEIKNMYVA
ncbi:MAG: hypothetical protein U0457_02385 [Candidatus Sericytochromatia bacterium]